VVLVPDEIRRYVPVETSASGWPVIQWEKDQAEDAGLVKIDLLGNRSLAVIRDALVAVHRNTGRLIDYELWDPISDPVTQELIRRGDTMGCFYVESPATRLLLKKLWTTMPKARRAHADVFEYLVVVSSIIRPAANVYADDFVRRSHGHPYRSWHPLLDEVLAETHGIMVYQEDVMKVAVALGGFSVHDGDQLRKILSKKHKERQLRDYQRQFYEGAAARDVHRSTTDKIWAMIMSFSGYSFCKPHSASYAQVSFKSAYLRAHYPAEFLAAVISNQGGYYSAFAYLSEGRRMGLTISSTGHQRQRLGLSWIGPGRPGWPDAAQSPTRRIRSEDCCGAEESRRLSLATGFSRPTETRDRPGHAAHQIRLFRFHRRRTDPTGADLEALRRPVRETCGLSADSTGILGSAEARP
jgi:DNA polymerase III alpha subunit